MKKDHSEINERRISSRYAFIAEHRGGPLSLEYHRRLMQWARACASHVLPLIDREADERLGYALKTAEAWEKDGSLTGRAMKASLDAHAVARETDDPVYKAVARAIGQAVATAHMADHSLGGAFYALKAVKLAGGDLEEEWEWQEERRAALPEPLQEIIRNMWEKKEMDKRI